MPPVWEVHQSSLRGSSKWLLSQYRCVSHAALPSGRSPPVMGSGERLALRRARMAAFPGLLQVPRRTAVRRLSALIDGRGTF